MQTRHLTKQYQGTTVVENLNMSINRGEIYGFLGPNGAGKTTTIRMIMSLVKPTGGEVYLFGEKITSNNISLFQRIGAMIEYPGFYMNLTAVENLDIHRRMMGIYDHRSVYEHLKLVGLQEAGDKKVKQYSLGMKQRLGIARALLHHPEFLILDEPSNGLDPNGIVEIRELLLELSRKREISILVSSHILSEVQHLASKIGILHKGKLVEQLDFKELQSRNRNYIFLRVTDSRKTAYLLEQKMNIHDYTIIENGVFRVYERLDETEVVNQILVSHGVGVKEMKLSVDSLEDYYLKLTGGNKHGESVAM
nr:ABC transporter ATP-binding protein [Paenactinomyces guangxiensis]